MGLNSRFNILDATFGTDFSLLEAQTPINQNPAYV